MLSHSIESKVDYALAYANRGWRVVPVHTLENGACTCRSPNCHSPGKHPMVSAWNVRATSNEGTIATWWSQVPEANIGVVTGKISGIWSLDVDGKEGKKSMADVTQKFGNLPSTYMWITGGGGYQILFKYPEDMKVRNRTGVYPSVDVRGENGFVLAPPSDHCSGRKYHTEVPIDYPVVDAPEWLLKSVCSFPEMTLVPGEGLTISNGARNDELFRMGMTLRRTFPGLDKQVVYKFLREVNKQHAEVPVSESEILQITNSVFKY